MNTSVTASDPAPPKEGDGWYCVIGPNVTQAHPIKRSWKNNLDDAVAHAERLIRNSFDGTKVKTQKLLVVKVMEVIEVEGPPLTRRSGKDVTREDVGGPVADDDE